MTQIDIQLEDPAITVDSRAEHDSPETPSADERAKAPGRAGAEVLEGTQEFDDQVNDFEPSGDLLEPEDEDEDEVLDEEGDTEYLEDFDTEQLSRIIKISGLSNTMQIFPKEELPLCFRTNIGSLGKLSIFIKSKKQIEFEELNKLDSDNDE